MTVTKITKFARWLQGTAPLPSGAIPLAADNGTGLICLMPTGRWILWLGGVMSSLPPETQKGVMEVVVEDFGGTAQSVADEFGVSRRTVEAWRAGHADLTAKMGYEIAQKIAAKEAP